MKYPRFTAVTGRPVTAPRADPADTYPVRLDAAAAQVEDLRGALEAAIELRDSLIVGAVEAGYTNRETGRYARVSEARVVAILARS